MFEGHGVAKAALYEAQHGKCAYCEMVQQRTAQPVEHFRPKARVTQEPRYVTSTTGYWWLAWTWTNLYFSCTTCNSPARKGNHFALELGSTPLTPEQLPPSEERPLFIDPAAKDEDPIAHIVFVQAKRGHWIPRPRRGSKRGSYTIDKLGLDRTELVTLYRNHVERTVQPCLDDVRAALQRDVPREVHHAWSRCLRRLFHPKAPFHALSYDVLDGLVPTDVRIRWRLDLPRPWNLSRP
ncbi:HNH endonuclease family protein [Paraliomyxa miuraensis]|uniref:hypothetical protein n=1 Tax=Paraliomyxa miuraensis TaxID=376150 RepID=UPI00225B679E|nr:hypothetical protein [Paraliomyxa miuraensis]MCX4245699.1 hypothetical protein [Paraliomyxa miuraensis]